MKPPWKMFVARWHLNIGGQELGLDTIAERHENGLWAVMINYESKKGIFSYVTGDSREYHSPIPPYEATDGMAWSQIVAALYTDVQAAAVALLAHDTQPRAYAAKLFPRPR